MDYDLLGRTRQDRATELGSGVDDGVLRIETSYNERGLVAKITCYDDADVGEGNIVNEVAMTYNDFGLLTKDAQSHAGAVNGSTPAVQYAYADGTDNHTRPTSCTYPDGRVITYDYGTSGGMDDILSRLSAFKESTDTRAAYTYLGMGAVVQVDLPEPDLVLLPPPFVGEGRGGGARERASTYIQRSPVGLRITPTSILPHPGGGGRTRHRRRSFRRPGPLRSRDRLPVVR